MSFIFVPVYISYIGIEAYGVIGLFVSLQVWMTVLDMGLEAIQRTWSNRPSELATFRYAALRLPFRASAPAASSPLGAITTGVEGAKPRRRARSGRAVKRVSNMLFR